MASTTASPASPTHKTYRGCCHCQAVVFRASFPLCDPSAESGAPAPRSSSTEPLEYPAVACPPAVRYAEQCDCSFCVRHGVLWAWVPPGAELVFERGREGLSEYTFGDGRYKHLFCGKCGTYIGIDPTRDVDERGRAINVRALREVEIWDLEPKQIHLASRPPAWEPAVAPSHSLELASGERLYVGGCHCRAVEFAVASKPLDELTDLCDCNCSICSGNGVLWMYPAYNKVAFSPSSAAAMEPYGFASIRAEQAADPSVKVNEHFFCRTCGVNVCEYRKGEDGMGLNLRCLNEWQDGMVQVGKEDGKNDPPTVYELP